MTEEISVEQFVLIFVSNKDGIGHSSSILIGSTSFDAAEIMAVGLNKSIGADYVQILHMESQKTVVVS